MKLHRTNDKIHTPDCRYGALDWTWALQRPQSEVIVACRLNGLTECGKCRPFAGALRAKAKR